MMPNMKTSMISGKTLFSTVIVTWNRKKDLSAAIDSVIMQKGVDKEIIVIDNNSADGTDNLMAGYQQKYPFIKYLKMKENAGYIIARNKGVTMSKGEVVFMLDDDAEIHDEEAFLKIDSKFSETWADVITVKFINLYTKEDEGFVYAHNHVEYHDKSFFAFGFNGGSTFFKKYIFDKIGGLDEKFFRQGEETDFSYRMLKGGLFTFFFPGVIVYHKVNPYRQSRDTILYFSLRNTLIGIWKNLPLFEAVMLSLVNLLLYIQIAFRSRSFLFPMRALFSFLMAIPYIVRHRSPLNREELRSLFYLMTHPVSCREEAEGAATIGDYMAYYMRSKRSVKNRSERRVL